LLPVSYVNYQSEWKDIMRILQRPGIHAWLVAAPLLIGCSTSSGPLGVEIQHSPVVATSAEQVTFTATLREQGSGSCKMEILVNAALVKTCNNMSMGDTCTFTGGPFAAYEGTTVSYLATATDSDGNTSTRGYYYFAITDSSHNWSLDYLPARHVGANTEKIDFVFHPATDYSSFTAFVDHVGDKMWQVFGDQAIIGLPSNLDKINFYIYPEDALNDNCGTVDSGANTDIPWRDVDAVLHTVNLGDCTINQHFTAEGHNTKAFLHESGHGVFDVADEYDGCGTYYFATSVEPNIFDTEADCRTEQTAKGRNPGACWKFTSCQGDWWGIHQLTDNTVMIRGMVGDSWGTEAAERVQWVFAQHN
jgi:hypothetical protein